METIRIGTRSSALALHQAELVASQLKSCLPSVTVSIVKIKTQGDKLLDVPLADIGSKGLFTSEIEQALMRGDVDLAVHSAKDLPTDMTPGVQLTATLKREDVRDVIVSRDGLKLDELGQKAVIGTSSLRRQAVMQRYNSTWQLKPVRGNVQTRIQKVRDGEYDAVVLAAAGLVRLNFQDQISEYLDPYLFLPAVGQGAIGIQTKVDAQDINEALRKINDQATFDCVQVERVFLEAVQGGCQVPVGVYTQQKKNEVHMKASILSIDGSCEVTGEIKGSHDTIEQKAKALAQQLLQQGGAAILREIRHV